MYFFDNVLLFQLQKVSIFAYILYLKDTQKISIWQIY